MGEQKTVVVPVTESNSHVMACEPVVAVQAPKVLFAPAAQTIPPAQSVKLPGAPTDSNV
jgi:hypothetical protein